MRRLDGVWQPDNPDGVAFRFFNNHEQAKKITSTLIPEALSLALRHTPKSSVYALDFHKGSEFLINISAFLTPDADDPDRLESGWMVVQIRGGIEHLEKYKLIAIGMSSDFLDKPEFISTY